MCAVTLNLRPKSEKGNWVCRLSLQGKVHANDIERGSEPSMQWLLFPWLSRPLHTLSYSHHKMRQRTWVEDHTRFNTTWFSLPQNFIQTLRLNSSAEFQTSQQHIPGAHACLIWLNRSEPRFQSLGLIYNIIHFSLYLLHQWSHVGLMGPTSV